MLKRISLIFYSFIFLNCLYSNDIIKFNPKTFSETIKTKYGILSYEYYPIYDSDRSQSIKYYMQLINVKNLTLVNFEELRKKYNKYKIVILLEKLDTIKIIFPLFNSEICYLILAEILYITGYINKKICVIEKEESAIYFGENNFINKNLKKFTFNEKDTFKQVLTSNSLIYINTTINFFDFFSCFTFDFPIKKILFQNNYRNIYYNGYTIPLFREGKYNITFILNNKIIRLGKVNTNKNFANYFFDNFYFREYDLDKKEFNFYLDPSCPNDNIITEIKESNINKTNYITFIIFIMVVLSISYRITTRNKKKNNVLYPNNISDVY